MLSLPKPMQHDLLDCAGFIPVREPNTVLEFIVKINSNKPDIIKPYVFITMKISTEAGMTLNTNKQTLNKKLIKAMHLSLTAWQIKALISMELFHCTKGSL